MRLKLKNRKANDQPAWRIDRAGAHDLPQCVTIYNRARARSDCFDGPDIDLTQFLTLTQDEALFIAIHTDGQIGGFASVFEPASFIHHLYIDPEVQRSGLATLLTNVACQHCASPPRLKCLIVNHAARAFYRSLGWHESENPEFSHEGDWIWITARS